MSWRPPPATSHRRPAPPPGPRLRLILDFFPVHPPRQQGHVIIIAPTVIHFSVAPPAFYFKIRKNGIRPVRTRTYYSSAHGAGDGIPVCATNGCVAHNATGYARPLVCLRAAGAMESQRHHARRVAALTCFIPGNRPAPSRPRHYN